MAAPPPAPWLSRTRRISWAPSGWIGHWITPENNTRLLTVACGDDFHAVRVGFANPTAHAWKLSRCIAAPSSTLGDGCNPTGDPVWRTFTFAGRGLDLGSLVTMAGAPTTINVKGSDPSSFDNETVGPQWTWSDWIALRSMQRTDRMGAPRLLMIRSLIEKNTRWTGPNGGFAGYGLRHRVNKGFEHVCGAYPMDAASRPIVINAEAAGLGVQAQAVSCVQFLTENEGIVGMSAGDSHHQGTSTTTQFLSYLLRATIALGSRCVGRIPFGCVNCAQGGFASQQMFAALARLLPAVAPSYVVLPGWTWNEVNEGVHADEVAMEQFFARLLIAAEDCKRAGARPIFLTPFPRDADAMTSVQIKPWRSLRLAILNMRRSGATVIDASDILGSRLNGELTGSYRAGMTSDSAHPNDGGHTAIATALESVVGEMLENIALC